MFCTECWNFEEDCVCADPNLVVSDECDECGDTYPIDDLNHDNLCIDCEE